MPANDVRLLILGGSPHHPGGIEAFCARAKEALEAQTSYHVEAIPTHSGYFGWRQLPSLLRSMWGLATLRWRGLDCVWLQYGNIVDLTYLPVARLLGFTVMVTPHLGSNWRSQQSTTLRWIGERILRHAHRLALISRTQELEIALPPDVPRSHIRNFLPDALLKTAAPQSDDARPPLKLVHAARLSAAKGTFLFVDLCRELRAAGVPFLARISGGADADTMDLLERQILDYELTDQVHVLGRISDAALISLLQTSDVLVHFSKIDSYPLIVLESIACGVFPVCMDLAGARDMVETYAGRIVSQQSAVAEAAAFLACETRAALQDQSLEAARRVRADYDWSACVRAVQAAVTATLQPPSGTHALQHQ